MLIHIVIAVWGKKYIQLMRDYALPTLLYPNNLVSVAAKHKCVLALYCPSGEEDEIREILTVARIFDLCEVAFMHIDPESAPNRYVAMARAHHHASVRGKALAAKMIFYFPDGMMADGTLERAIFLAEQGKRAVLTPGLRISDRAAEQYLKPLVRVESPMSPRAMLKTVFPFLHPEMYRYFWDSEDFSGFPAFCCWRVENEGFLTRAFHLHTFMIDFSCIGPIDVLQRDTVDGNFVGTAIGKWSDVHIEQDSDNLGLYSITPDDAFFSESTHTAGSIEALRSVAYHPLVNAFHRYLFSHAIKIHVSDLNEKWTQIEEETGLLLCQALQPIPPASEISIGARIEVDKYTKYVYDRVREFHWTISRWIRRVLEILAR